MRFAIRSAGVALLVVFAAIVLAVSTTMTSVANAATALVTGGSGHPLAVPPDTPEFISGYVAGVNPYWILPTGFCGDTGCTLLATYTPDEPTFDQAVAAGRANLDNCLRGNANCIVTPPPYTVSQQQLLSDTSYVVYGASRSATEATAEKRYLIDNPVADKTVNFSLIANPNRPHGGIIAANPGSQQNTMIPDVFVFDRVLSAFLTGDFSLLTSIPDYTAVYGVTSNGGPTPTDTNMLTVDVARQYDVIADFPTNPTNTLALLNAYFGFHYLHGDYRGGTPLLQGQYGDTTYYLIPTPVLPLLMPLEPLPGGTALALGLDPVLRVLVETAYDRTINPGQPTPANPEYYPNPSQMAANLALAIQTGMDNFISYTTNNPANRPFGTAVQGPYGVGARAVDTGCGTPPCGPPTPLTTPSPASAPLSEPTVVPSATDSDEPNPDVTTATSTPSTTKTRLPVSTVTAPHVTNGRTQLQNSAAISSSATNPTGTLSAPTTQITKKPTPPRIRKPVESRLPVGASNSSSTVGPPATGALPSEGSISATDSSTGDVS
jgi:hypothetical protein